MHASKSLPTVRRTLPALARFAFLQSALEEAIGLTDTCGVLNLHGIPGVLGGLAAAIASVVDFEANAHVRCQGCPFLNDIAADLPCVNTVLMCQHCYNSCPRYFNCSHPSIHTGHAQR